MNNSTQTYSFQAEVKQVLDIVVHSLYTDKEIFVRELISNASDASEKLRHLQFTESNIFQKDQPLEILIHTDETNHTITIQDYGIGMTKEELIENLGTIAHSGSKAFLEALKAKGSSNDNLIGQFGVGFYSVFMVAKKVTVETRSWKTDASSYKWSSDGSSSYSIEESDFNQRGSKITIELKEDFYEFDKKSRIESILKKYSNFVSFPIQLNNEKVNTVDSIWLKNKKDIQESEYKEFYKFKANAFDEPLFWLHFNADAPIAINALIFCPSTNKEKFGFGKHTQNVSLYCRKILISEEPKNLLPEWLRFTSGVIDSADLPLNISRESMQDSALMHKINNVVTKRFIKKLEELAKNDPSTFESFWKEFGIHIKEGVVIDPTHRDSLGNLLRFESSQSDSQLISLNDYLNRMPSSQKSIYYLIGSSKKIIESSPYLEAFKSRNIEVLYFYEHADEIVISHLKQFEGKNFISIDQADVQLDDTPQTSDSSSNTQSSLDKDHCDSLCTFFKEILGDKSVEKVSISNRLTDSPIIALNSNPMMNASMRKMMQAMNPNSTDNIPTPVQLEINPKHPIILNLSKIKDSNNDLAQIITHQLFDNALLAAGLIDDPKSMVNRINSILEKVSST